jgi:hypothetical protein
MPMCCRAAALLAATGLPWAALAEFNAPKYLSYQAGRLLVQPQFDASVQYTDNLFYAPRNASPGSAGYGVPVASDFIFTLSPGIELQYGRNKERNIELEAFVDELLYATYSSFDSPQVRGAMEVHWEFGRFVLQGTDSIGWLNQILGGNVATEYRKPIRTLAWNDNYRLTYDATMKTDVYVVLNHNEQSFLQTVNLYSQNSVVGSLGSTYKPFERLGFFLEGEGGYTGIDAASPQLAPASPSTIYGGFVGARGNFTARLDGSIKAGYEVREFSSAANVANTPSPAAGVALTYTESSRRSYVLSFDRSVGVSVQVPDQAFVFDNVAFTFTQGMGTSGRWTLQAQPSVSLGNYTSLYRYNGPTLVDFARNDQTYTMSVTMAYQPNAWLKASLNYTFQAYTAEFPDPQAEKLNGVNNFMVNRITLQLSIGY